MLELEIASFVTATIAMIAAIWGAIQGRKLERDLKQLDARISGRTQLIKQAHETAMAVLKVVTEIEYIVNLQRRKHVEKDLQHQFWIDFRLNAIELKTIASALNDEILSNLVGELLNTQLVLVDEMELSDLKATSTVRDRMEHYKGKLTLILIRIHELNVSVDVS